MSLREWPIRSSNTLFTVSQMKDVARVSLLPLPVPMCTYDNNQHRDHPTTQRVGVKVDSFEDLVFTLNNESYLLKKGPKTYQLQTAGLTVNAPVIFMKHSYMIIQGCIDYTPVCVWMCC